MNSIYNGGEREQDEGVEGMWWWRMICDREDFLVASSVLVRVVGSMPAGAKRRIPGNITSLSTHANVATAQVDVFRRGLTFIALTKRKKEAGIGIGPEPRQGFRFRFRPRVGTSNVCIVLAGHCPPPPGVRVDDATTAAFKVERTERALSSGVSMGTARSVVAVAVALCSGAVAMLALPGDRHSDYHLLARNGRRAD